MLTISLIPNGDELQIDIDESNRPEDLSDERWFVMRCAAYAAAWTVINCPDGFLQMGAELAGIQDAD